MFVSQQALFPRSMPNKFVSFIRAGFALPSRAVGDGMGYKWLMVFARVFIFLFVGPFIFSSWIRTSGRLLLIKCSVTTALVPHLRGACVVCTSLRIIEFQALESLSFDSPVCSC